MAGMIGMSPTFKSITRVYQKTNAELEVELEVTAEIKETLKITLSELITSNKYEQSFKMKTGSIILVLTYL